MVSRRVLLPWPVPKTATQLPRYLVGITPPTGLSSAVFDGWAVGSWSGFWLVGSAVGALAVGVAVVSPPAPLLSPPPLISA
jgi:hypothetical protein